MSLTIIDEPVPPRKHVQITEGMSGHFAVIVWWNPDMGGFWEPWNTGIGRYATRSEAYAEAKVLGESEGLPVLRVPALEVSA